MNGHDKDQLVQDETGFRGFMIEFAENTKKELYDLKNDLRTHIRDDSTNFRDLFDRIRGVEINDAKNHGGNGNGKWKVRAIWVERLSWFLFILGIALLVRYEVLDIMMVKDFVSFGV